MAWRGLLAWPLLTAACLDYDALSRGAPDLGDGAADLSVEDLARGDGAAADLAASIDLTGAPIDLAGGARDLSAPFDLSAAAADLRGVDFGGVFCGATFAASCPSGALRCESWESGTGAWTTTINPVSNTFATGGNACRGSAALHAATSPMAGDALGSAAISPTATLYVRAYLYFPSAPGDAFLLSVSGASTTGGGLAVRGGKWSGSANAVDATSSQAVPIASWSCVELMFSGSAPLALWVDDQPVALPGAGTPPAGTFDSLVVGVLNLTATGVDVWYDEVVASGTRIGCL